MAGVRPSAAGGALFDAFCLGPEGEEVCLGAGLEREDALERVKIAGWWHRLHACDDISGVEIDEPGWTEEDSLYFAELSWQGLLDSVWGGGGQAEEPGEPAASEPQVGGARTAGLRPLLGFRTPLPGFTPPLARRPACCACSAAVKGRGPLSASLLRRPRSQAAPAAVAAAAAAAVQEGPARSSSAAAEGEEEEAEEEQQQEQEGGSAQLAAEGGGEGPSDEAGAGASGGPRRPKRVRLGGGCDRACHSLALVRSGAACVACMPPPTVPRGCHGHADFLWPAACPCHPQARTLVPQSSSSWWPNGNGFTRQVGPIAKLHSMTMPGGRRVAGGRWGRHCPGLHCFAPCRGRPCGTLRFPPPSGFAAEFETLLLLLLLLG